LKNRSIFTYFQKMSFVEIFERGSEDIFYNYSIGDITISYYLLCKLDNDRNILKSIAFGYSHDYDFYFNMNTELLENIYTIQDANEYIVAFKKPSIDDEIKLSDLMLIEYTDIFFKYWIDFIKNF